MHLTPPIAWTIAGSDSGGGAGIQSDLRSFHDFGVHGCTVITALTAQNSMTISNIRATDSEQIMAQIEALDSDLAAQAIKLGMLANSTIIRCIASYLKSYSGFVVCDPVLQSSNNHSLLDSDALQAFKQLLPRIDLLTPNIGEAETLTGLTITTTEQLTHAAQALLAVGVRAVLITGGHFKPINNQRLDYYCDKDHSFWLAGENIATDHSHGSGCTLSSAITAAIAKGYELRDALVLAKAYTSQGLRHSVQLGSGPGPVAHLGFPKQLEDLPHLTPHLTPHLIPKADGLPLEFASCGDELGIYPVVDSIEWLEKLMPLGITTIQLRIKNADANLSAIIAHAVLLAQRYRVRLFINDHWQLAIEHSAYGVHLGQEDIESADLKAISAAGLRLGISTHSYYEIARAHAIGPSYIAIGPIYATNTKVMRFSERGLERLRQWVRLLKPRYLLTAIGGINLERAPGVLATGVNSCAVVSAITLADDYQDAVRLFLQQQQNHL
jgi:hydroxymethylpyrimidine kinase/phosphomethylpyrimidine kinase/thiamine-phosphate diphosphorylase